MKIGIAGAGIVGRLFAWRLLQAGHRVELFDRDTRAGTGSAASVAAGMLSPLLEIEKTPAEIFAMGCESIALWIHYLKELPGNIFFQQQGTLMVTHTRDKTDLIHAYNLLQRKLDINNHAEVVSADGIQKLEPELAHFTDGIYFPLDAQIDGLAVLNALADVLCAKEITWHENRNVTRVSEHCIETENDTFTFDCVIDARGVGGKQHFPDLRAVRGELIHVHAPQVHIQRLLRFHHPRYRVYIVPRPDQHYIIGATEIEAEDYSPVSVQSALELLSAAYSVHPGFAEGRIVKLCSQCRPALADNLPRIVKQKGLIAINGLFRNGFLLTPALVERVLAENFKE